MTKALCLLAALLAAVPLGAWEAKPARLEKRLAGLAEAWKGLEPKALGEDKLGRAKQRKPGWVGRTCWEEVHKGKFYLFGVGSVQGMTNKVLAVEAAENRATVELIKERISQVAAAGGTERPKVDANPVDWYRDEASNTVHALVVEVK